MDLFLPTDLCKGEDASEPPSGGGGKSQSNEQGETRGGKYAARLQTGYEKDGSPRYKYFQSFDDRDQYLASRGKSKESEGGKKLKDKLSDEKDKSKDKQGQTPGKNESANLFVSSTKKDKNKVDKKTEPKEKDNKMSKSIPTGTPLFIWKID